jgi:hypothetical protein
VEIGLAQFIRAPRGTPHRAARIDVGALGQKDVTDCRDLARSLDGFGVSLAISKGSSGQNRLHVQSAGLEDGAVFCVFGMKISETRNGGQ